MRFRLWASQVRALWTILASRKLIILKARQLGISWLCCAYALWLCVFQRGKLVLIFSQTEDDAFELVRRVAGMYERLPEWIRAESPLAKEPAGGKIEWKNGSRIKGRAATERSGRTFTASAVIIDEAAFVDWIDKVLTGAQPTIDAGGQLILLSTANGIGKTFHNTYLKAVAGENGYSHIFLPWWAAPWRTVEWLKAAAKSFSDPRKAKQEYPCTATEAFISSQNTRFPTEWIAAQESNFRPPLPSDSLPDSIRTIPGLKAWRLPWQVPEVLEAKPKRLVLGADVAEGGEKGDYSAAVLVDEDGEQWLSLHGHWEPGVYGAYLDTIARAYEAEIAVERNNHGHAVLLKLKDLHSPLVTNGADGKRGWLTNVRTKPQMIDLLAEWLRDEVVTVRDVADSGEMQVYEVKPDGSTGAPSNYHDDRVMAWAIALGVHKLLGSRVWKFT